MVLYSVENDVVYKMRIVLVHLLCTFQNLCIVNLKRGQLVKTCSLFIIAYNKILDPAIRHFKIVSFCQ